jgi:hypothetical protein
MNCIQEKNLARCHCSYEPCPRKGNCCECLRYHASMRQLPACVFPNDAERTYPLFRAFRPPGQPGACLEVFKGDPLWICRRSQSVAAV